MAQKILVIGSPGAGKSTFARKLRVERELDPEFARYIAEFPQTRLPKIYRLLEQYGQGREIVIFHGREEAENWLAHFTPGKEQP